PYDMSPTVIYTLALHDALPIFWASSQTPRIMRTALATSLRLDESRVRVIAPDVGGGFGLKMHVFPEDVAVATLARRLGSPVKWIDRKSTRLNSSHQIISYAVFC